MSFGSRLKELREYRKVTQPELAEIMGVSTQSVYYYERDKSWPNLDGLEAVMEALGCDANYLLQDHVEVEPITFSTSIREQDLIKDFRAAGAKGRKLIEDVAKLMAQKGPKPTNDRLVELPVLAAGAYPGEKILAAAIGDSLEPLFEDGDVLIIDPEAKPREGDVVALEIGGRIIARRIQDEKFMAINGDYDTFEPGAVEVIGKVVGKV